jgi:hypothetical protein
MFSSRYSLLAVSFFLLGTVACASGGSGTERSGSFGDITRAELDVVDAFMVEGAVRLLRPNWMSRLSGACYEEEGLTRDDLSRLPLSNILKISQMTASEAASKCGISGTDMMASGVYLFIERLR